jgi:endonuclease/exonuclease/phosphatase family metal-dependent hydrolase
MIRKDKAAIRRKFKTLDKIVLILNIISVLSLLLSYLAPSNDPRDYWIIAILGFGFQVLFFINLIFIIYWLVRLKAFALISIIIILIGYNILSLNYRLNGVKPVNIKNQIGTIRMMAYNVRAFYGIDTVEEKPIQYQVSQLVQNIQPDIIAIEEYATNTSRTDTISNLLEKVLKTDYYYLKLYGPVAKGKPDDSTGNAIFSKYPIINSGYVPSPALLHLKAIFVDIKFNNKIFRVYCIHLAAVDIKDAEKDQYLNGKINFWASDFIIGRLTSAFIIRSHQVELIKRHIEKCPYPYIIAGDFNDTPNSYSVNELGDGLKNAFTEKGSGFGFTYYNKFPKLHIDYILVSPQFDVLNYQEIDKKLSDHKPIVSDLKLNN